MRKTEKDYWIRKCVLCKFGSNCRDKKNCFHSHSEKEKLKAINMLKEETCYSWMRYNDCRYKDDCRRLHGFKELENSSPYNCTLINEIEMTKLAKAKDIFPNGNILIQYDDELCLFDPKGNTLFEKYLQFDAFHIINNQKILFSNGNSLTMANLINRDGQLDIEFTNRKDIEYKLINDFFRILPNGNIIVNNGNNLEILDQHFSLIKKINIPSNESNGNDICKYEIFVAMNKIFISTPSKITYVYDFELNLIDKINDYFKEDSIIENVDKIYFLWYEDGATNNRVIGSFKFNEYSNMNKKVKKLKYKITEIYRGTNDQYFIGKSGATLIFYSTIDLKIVGYCHITHPKYVKVMVKNNKIYVFYEKNKKIEIYSINYNN